MQTPQYTCLDSVKGNLRCALCSVQDDPRAIDSRSTASVRVSRHTTNKRTACTTSSIHVSKLALHQLWPGVWGCRNNMLGGSCYYASASELRRFCYIIHGKQRAVYSLLWSCSIAAKWCGRCVCTHLGCTHMHAYMPPHVPCLK